jgi:REP element-mobilizing transposase RayT
MDPVGRKTLSHDVPPTIVPNPEGDVFFITINTLPRGTNQLAAPEVWESIIETIRIREANHDFRCPLLLAMPDHLHGLFEFPGEKTMKNAIASFKSWLAKTEGIRWQRDFFDHRLRNLESAIEKAHYIRMNPVRAGLVERTEDWPYQR